MITIRYANLPEGLHAQAEARGRRTVLYLRPGLTPEQRRHGVRRARQSGRMGYGPRLPAAWLAVAVAGDAVRGTVRNVGAAMRTHPFGSVLLAAGVAAAMVCYVLFVAVSIRMMTPNQQPPPLRGSHALAGPVGPGQVPVQRAGRPPPPGAPGGRPQPVTSATGGHGTPSQTPRPTPSPDQAPSPVASASSSPPPVPSPSPSPSVSSSPTCVHVGPLGVCLG